MPVVKSAGGERPAAWAPRSAPRPRYERSTARCSSTTSYPAPARASSASASGAVTAAGGKTAGRGDKGQGSRAGGTKGPGSRVARRRSQCDSRSPGLQQPLPGRVLRRQRRPPRDLRRGRRRVTPDTLGPRASWPSGAWSRFSGRGELTKSLTVRAHGFSGAAVRRSRRRAGRPRSPGSVGRPPPAGPRERTHQPVATLASPYRQEVVSPHVWALAPANMFRVPDLRNKIFFTIFIIAIFRIGAYIPVPYVDFHAILALKKAVNGNAARSASSTCSRAARSAARRCSRWGSCRTSRRRSSCSCSAS